MGTAHWLADHRGTDPGTPRRSAPPEPADLWARETAGRAPDWLRALLEEIEADPGRRWRDGELREAGLDPARVRRWFKTHHGMTFHAYQRARRLGRADDLSSTEPQHFHADRPRSVGHGRVGRRDRPRAEVACDGEVNGIERP